MTMTLGERVRKALAGPPKHTQKALADACNITTVSVNDWFHDRTKSIEGANLLAAAAFLEVNAKWLANGVGPMRAGVDINGAARGNGVSELAAARAKRWPYKRIDYEKLTGLTGPSARNLENAILAAAAEIEIDIRVDRKGKRKAA